MTATGPTAARVAVLAPSPILTVTLEREDGQPELHLHPGGQGFWVARMVAELGAEVGFCAPLGGEVGTVLRTLLEHQPLDLRTIETSGWNGSYIHERRDGGLTEVGSTDSPRLARHETDALYTAMVSVSLEARLAVLTGPRADGVVEPDFFRRLAADLRDNGRPIVADLSGRCLNAALAGGVDVLHISQRELGDHVGRRLLHPAEIAAEMERLHAEGARQVVVSRGPRPALALLDGGFHELVGPVLHEREHRGAGDSMFAAIGAAMALGEEIGQALRLGVAAGALNVARRGLGSGSRGDIERLSHAVELRPIGTPV